MTSPNPNPNPNDGATITVLGATGTTGSRVARLLRRRGHPVRDASRRTDPRFDWTEPSTWPAVLAGADRLYLVPPDPGTDADGFVAAAAASGVERIVVLSARGPDQSGDRHLLDVEAAVTGAVPSWTVVRPAWFAQNFSEGFFRAALDAGELRLPTGDGREPFIDVDDIAEVVAAALTEDGHDGQTYELSGPEALTFAAATDELARATGRPFRFVPIELDEFAAEQAGYGTPAAAVDALANLFTAIRDGRNDQPSDGVHRALGRPPTSFADFCTRAAASW